MLNTCLSLHYQPGDRAALQDVCIEVGRGELVGVVGESGAGKSSLGAALMRLESLQGARASGSIHFEGLDLLRLDRAALRDMRGRRIALIHQNAASSLNPALTIEKQFRLAWQAHSDEPWPEAQPWVAHLLASVGLSDMALLKRKPHQAALHRPLLLIADEPTSAVDSVHRLEVLRLFQILNRDLGTAVLLISHDLLSVAAICERIYVLQGGCVVEHGPVSSVLQSPRHSFTKSMVEAWRGALDAARLSPTTKSAAS